nr:MAG TPA: InsA C-terminal domain [Caudoviricetes sp.]
MKYDIGNRIKDTALINLVDFENAIDLYEDGEVEKALELMFGVTILGLGGKFETDDKEIRRLLKNREYTAEKSNKAYCNKVKTEEEKRIEKLQLREIAGMLENGVPQQVIADTLGVSLRTVEYRIGVMKAEFPSIYSISTKTAKNRKQPQYNDNDNDNVNDNVKENEKEKDNEKEKEKENDNENEKKDFSYLYNEVACDGYIRKEKKWIDKICWNFRTMSAQERIEYIEKLDFTHEEAEYIVNNILEI